MAKPTDAEMRQTILDVRDRAIKSNRRDLLSTIYSSTVGALGQERADRILRPVVVCGCGARLRLNLSNEHDATCPKCRVVVTAPAL